MAARRDPGGSCQAAGGGRRGDAGEAEPRPAAPEGRRRREGVRHGRRGSSRSFIPTVRLLIFFFFIFSLFLSPEALFFFFFF